MPLLFATNPDVVWTLIAALFVGNTLLLILNLPFVKIWVKLLKIPKPYLFAGITTFALMTIIQAISLTVIQDRIVLVMKQKLN